MISYLVFAKIDSKITTEEYAHHKEAYDMYHTIIGKLRKRLQKINPTDKGKESTTDGYDRIFECSLGMVTCGEVPNDLMI
jgi:hypothetical protein